MEPFKIFLKGNNKYECKKSGKSKKKKLEVEKKSRKKEENPKTLITS